MTKHFAFSFWKLISSKYSVTGPLFAWLVPSRHLDLHLLQTVCRLCTIAVDAEYNVPIAVGLLPVILG